MEKSTFVEACFELYEQKMYQIAYGILRDAHSAEDAVQDAFLKLVTGKRIFEDVRSDDCKRYLITVIKHVSVTIYNEKKRNSETTDLLEQTMRSKNAEWDVDIGLDDIRDCIAHLPKKYADIVECMVVLDMSVKDTAAALNISEANVRKRFQRSKYYIAKMI